MELQYCSEIMHTPFWFGLEPGNFILILWGYSRGIWEIILSLFAWEATAEYIAHETRVSTEKHNVTTRKQNKTNPLALFCGYLKFISSNSVTLQYDASKSS